MISLNKCNGSCNVFSPKICVPKKTKDINVKIFNMITIKNKPEEMKKHISCDYKYKFNCATCNSNKKWYNETCQCECKNYCTCKKDYSWNPSTFICENSKYLKSVFDTSVISCDEITFVMFLMDILSTKKANTIATNVSINSDVKK